MAPSLCGLQVGDAGAPVLHPQTLRYQASLRPIYPAAPAGEEARSLCVCVSV